MQDRCWFYKEQYVYMQTRSSNLNPRPYPRWTTIRCRTKNSITQGIPRRPTPFYTNSMGADREPYRICWLILALFCLVNDTWYPLKGVHHQP
ncbi:hypothetical protein CEXT_207441 [Caerostris extrusa]|uniref:Uncharacterized protein n=1 Tax=Caerostris extrusa TaxID=172846 RepID=A0AAV4VNX2_CAEEX|nr:hypothetical protein CEXT_207441 [Caerostris extrusa]